MSTGGDTASINCPQRGCRRRAQPGRRATDADDKRTQTSYANAEIGPEHGLVTASVVNPTGATPLVTSTTYETPGMGYLRPKTKTLPAGNTFSYTHYGETTPG